MRTFSVGFFDRFKRMDAILLTTTTIMSLMSLLTILGAVDNFGKSK